MPEYICPNCGKAIYDDEALLCLYCGESLKCSVGFMGGFKYPTPRVMLAIAIALLLLAFLLLMIRRQA